jgi:hypothetical protein
MSTSSDSFDRSSPQAAKGTVERDASREPRPCRRPDLQAVRVAADVRRSTRRSLWLMRLMGSSTSLLG